MDRDRTLPGQLGAHTFLWAPDFNGANAERVASGAAAAGIGLVEVPLLNPTIFDIQSAKTALVRYGITPTCSLGLPSDAHAPDQPERAIEFLCLAIDTAAALGSKWLTGALYGHLGRVSGKAPSAAEHAAVVHVLKAAADHAERREIRLGLEIINRYETHLINNTRTAVELLGAIDRPDTVFAHLDTFHMNIEEDDVIGAVRFLGDQLGYVHLAESNRGIIGSGIFPFQKLLSALTDIDFSGPAVMEAFSFAPNELLTITASWNPPRVDATTFISQSVRHLQTTREHLYRFGPYAN